jgi:hypothetical protein
MVATKFLMRCCGGDVVSRGRIYRPGHYAGGASW